MEAKDYLAAIRKYPGMTQAAIAERTGIPQPTISKIERGDVDDVMSRNYRALQTLYEELTNPRVAPANIAPAAIEPIAADAVVVAVLVAPVKPAVTTGAVQPRSGARRTGTPSPYNHSDIDRRDDLPGRREFNGGADKAKGV
jgi:transcriptional regulator with XRE-family HTH domain